MILTANQRIKMKDGASLFTMACTVNTAIANLIFLHGYTEHTGRYNWMFQKLNEANINVFAYDHRGFGKSDGERAYISDFDQYVEDMNAYVFSLNKPELPTFLMGHSMGSLIAVHYFISHSDHHFSGLISSSGALKIDEGISPLLRKISGIMSKVAPHLKTIKLDSNALSRDQEEVVKYNIDPLVYHDGAKARLGFEMLEAMKYAQENFYKIKLPVLILHGKADRLADPQGSQWMFDKISSSDKTISLFEGLYHEIMREPEKDQVMNAITDWIISRSA